MFRHLSLVFFFNDPATAEIYTLSLHDALPISSKPGAVNASGTERSEELPFRSLVERVPAIVYVDPARSEEHTSELQSQSNLVCRLLLEKKKANAQCQHLRHGRNTARRRTERRY